MIRFLIYSPTYDDCPRWLVSRLFGLVLVRTRSFWREIVNRNSKSRSWRNQSKDHDGSSDRERTSRDRHDQDSGREIVNQDGNSKSRSRWNQSKDQDGSSDRVRLTPTFLAAKWTNTSPEKPITDISVGWAVDHKPYHLTLLKITLHRFWVWVGNVKQCRPKLFFGAVRVWAKLGDTVYDLESKRYWLPPKSRLC